MRKLLLLCIVAAFASAAMAQTPTVVTGTVKDTNGIPYSFAKVSAQLIPTTSSPTIIVNGVPTQIGGQQNANADANGAFSMNLFCNTAGGGCSVISPSGTQWQITVNETGTPPPLGTGPQACSATLTITGASQSVSASFNACPALSNSSGGAPGGTNGQVQFNNGGAFGGIVASSTVNGGVSLISQVQATPALTLDVVGGNTNGSLVVKSNGSTFFSIDSNGAADVATRFQAAGSAAAFGSRATYGLDSVTTTPNFGTANQVSSFTGAWNCNSVTPVTVSANVATDQTLMACTIPAGTLNRVGRSLRIMTSSIYSTPAASTTAMTIKVKICSVSGCGSGNVLTAVTITSGALGTIQVTNNAIQLPFYLTVQTASTTLAVEAHGCMNIDLAASISAADTVFCDNNTTTQTGTPSAIDSTAQNFLQITGAFTVASASNSWSNRQLVVETIN